MTKSEMTCRNCIFFERSDDDDFDYCHLNAETIVDDDDDHIVNFPIVLNPRGMWCGQGEWEGVSKHDPTHKVLYRWGEWAA
jgi:hypothetical protein